jgi:two-component system, NtrC family, response regulator HydG
MRRILVVEDQQILREAILEVLGTLQVEAEGCATAAAALAAFEHEPAELVVTDLRLEDPEAGLRVLRTIKGGSPRCEVLLMTAFATVEVAVEAMKAGAFDFLVKPFSMAQLLEKARRILALQDERREMEREREQAALLRGELEGRFNQGRIVGASAPMLDLYRQIEKVADSPSSVLILGESGTGKELVARALHLQSRRKDGPFVKVNCGALAEGVLESELFGHERGAFTSAVRLKRGRFELADGGTILLDEIAEVSPAVQVKLLRVLQERQFERVGGEKTLSVDVRVLAATNRDLKAEVDAGRFREDLYYRLYVIPLRLPPLRSRREDIPLLCRHFIGRLCREMGRAPLELDPEALRLLTLYDWPGNVRELENVIERALVLSEGGRIMPRDLPFEQPREANPLVLPAGFSPLREVVERVERQMIERALQASGGVKLEAARILDLKPSVLYYKLEKYGMGGEGGE